MNISPHQQRTTKYPWPGMASRLAMIVGLALIVIIGFLVVADPFSGDSGGPGPSAIRSLVTYAS